MIAFFKSWCEGIIVAVIISIIIESMLPEGNHKKYVKVVVGIYLIFTILNPILGKFDTGFSVDSSYDLATVETASIDTENIRQLYASGIEETLKANIEEKFGYTVNKVQITYDEKYETIQKIDLSIQTGIISQVEKVEIGQTENKNPEEKQDFSEIKKYIAENYELEESRIHIE